MGYTIATNKLGRITLLVLWLVAAAMLLSSCSWMDSTKPPTKQQCSYPITVDTLPGGWIITGQFSTTEKRPC